MTQKTPPAVETRKNDDDTWTVLYRGEKAGYISRCKSHGREHMYRAVSIHGYLDHKYSLHHATAFILEQYA